MPEERMSMVVFSGTVDRLLSVAIMASGAVAMGMEVQIFLTFWGLNAFRKDQLQTNQRISADFSEMGEGVTELLERKRVPPWHETLATAKELGEVHIHACGMTMDLMELKKEELSDLIEDVAGVGEFVNLAKEGKITLYI